MILGCLITFLVLVFVCLLLLFITSAITLGLLIKLFAPVALIVFGLYVLINNRRKKF